MIRKYELAALVLLTGAPMPAVAQHAHETVATPAAPADLFAHGLFQLHNFEYSSAAEAFRAAQAAEPGNVMAYWGEAMTYNHPLWAEQDADSARAVLARLAPTAAERRARAKSPREAMWLDAVEALYGAGSKVERDSVYHQKMRILFESDPSDIDARAFYALATLGLANSGRDIPTYMRGAALLEEAFPANPNHPGVLHYLIHSYDDPAHAPLGERAAARYAKVAPNAGHAQHMVSHIYLSLGRWDSVEAANRQAVEVVNRQRAGTEQPPAHCGHYNEWLAYALDQQGKDSIELIDFCREQALTDLASASTPSVLGGPRNSFNSWAGIAVRHGVDTGRWPARVEIAADRLPALGRFELNYGRVLQARRDPAAAASALAALKDDHAIIAARLPKERPDDHASMPWFDLAVAQSEAIVALAAGEQERGLELLRAAAVAEQGLPILFGPPLLAKPSYELLGDELLALGRKREAAEAYRKALAYAPGRKLVLQGLEAASR